MNINNSFDRHLDPPDEPEQEYCESCGQEMEYHCDNVGRSNQEIWWKCLNPYCPEKFDIKCGTTVIEMANHLAEVEQELAYAKTNLKFMTNRASNWAIEFEKIVMENAKAQALPLKVLTQSQSKEVVRDTDYAIKRMDDAIELLYLEGIGAQSAVNNEWNEVKKILNYGK